MCKKSREEAPASLLMQPLPESKRYLIYLNPGAEVEPVSAKPALQKE